MAHVEKRGPGRWRARYRGPDGKERSRTFERKVDAERWLAENQADQSRGVWIDPRHGKVLFSDWADNWFATTVNLRPSTRARDESYLRTHVLPMFGHRQVASIQHMEVRAWVAELSSRRAPATVHLAFGILAKIMQAAIEAGLIPSSPCSNVALPRIEREEMRFLTPAEIGQLAEAIHPRYRCLVLVGAYGGLRIGELAGLKRERVDLLRGRVQVAEILTEIGGHLTWGQPKTRAGRRTVSLPRQVIKELAAHLEQCAGPELVFTAPEGGPLRVPAWRRRFWLPAVEAADLTPLRPHDLRHTAVALWIATGANQLEVTRRAGHASASFTLDRYGHLFEGADDMVSDRLAELYAPPAPAADATIRQIS